jgi:hypothetical protein
MLAPTPSADLERREEEEAEASLYFLSPQVFFAPFLGHGYNGRGWTRPGA